MKAKMMISNGRFTSDECRVLLHVVEAAVDDLTYPGHASTLQQSTNSSELVPPEKGSYENGSVGDDNGHYSGGSMISNNLFSASTLRGSTASISRDLVERSSSFQMRSKSATSVVLKERQVEYNKLKSELEAMVRILDMGSKADNPDHDVAQHRVSFTSKMPFLGLFKTTSKVLSGRQLSDLSTGSPTGQNESMFREEDIFNRRKMSAIVDRRGSHGSEGVLEWQTSYVERRRSSFPSKTMQGVQELPDTRVFKGHEFLVPRKSIVSHTIIAPGVNDDTGASTLQRDHQSSNMNGKCAACLSRCSVS
jgi:hypothetical protein